jgi:diadenosine tetraphosphatase ApaH/serine/threonine PP2A family protein phosphatase
VTRVGLISDIHANLHALEAVLAELDADELDEIWSLGDVVGYGPRPNECCRVTRERTALGMVGNHDLVVLGVENIAEFNPDAAAAARWTKDVLDDEARAYLSALEPTAKREGVELYHGSPRDPIWEYVLDPGSFRACFELTEAPLILIGHSHIPILARLDSTRMDAAHAPGGTEADLEDARVLINPGSVGQPRDGDPRAAYVVLDLARGSAEFRRAVYDVERTQRELRDAGLPNSLAERLELGV